MKMARPLPPLDEHHAAAACFHGLLSVLRGPLALFLYARCAEAAARPANAQSAWKVVHAGLRRQLAFLRDHSATHLRAQELPALLEDVKQLLSVQSACLNSANVGLATQWKGVQAAARLLVAVGADAYALEQAEVFKRMVSAPVQGPKEPECEDQGGEPSGNQDDEVDTGEMHEQPESIAVPGDRTTSTDERSDDGEESVSVADEKTASDAVPPSIVTNVRQVQLNGAKMRKWLVGQAFRAVDALPYLAGQEAEATAREVARLLAEALKYSKSQRQRGDIFLMRSEFHLSVGQLEQASEDAHAALIPMNIRSINHIKRIAMVFLNLGQYDDAALAYDTGLKQYPGNRQLLEAKKHFQAFKGQYLEVCGEASDVSTMVDGRARFGLYQNSLWAHGDPSSQADEGLTSDCSSWLHSQPELRDDTKEDALPTDSANGDTDLADDIGFADKDLVGSEELEDESWIDPTDSAYSVVEFALKTESQSFHSLPSQAESVVKTSSDRLESPHDETCPDPNCSLEEESTDQHVSAHPTTNNQFEHAQCTVATSLPYATETKAPPSSHPGWLFGWRGMAHPTPFKDDQLKHNYAIQKSARIGCFHALLSILRLPLAEYIIKRQEAGPPLDPDNQKLYKNVRKAGVKSLVQFVKTFWWTHFKESAPSSLLKNLKLVDQVQSQVVYSAGANMKVFDDGIKAVERILTTMAADTDTMYCARTIKEYMSKIIERNDEDRGVPPLCAGCAVKGSTDLPIAKDNEVIALSNQVEAVAPVSEADLVDSSTITDCVSQTQPDAEHSGKEEEDLTFREKLQRETSFCEKTEESTPNTTVPQENPQPLIESVGETACCANDVDDQANTNKAEVDPEFGVPAENPAEARRLSISQPNDSVSQLDVPDTVSAPQSDSTRPNEIKNDSSPAPSVVVSLLFSTAELLIQDANRLCELGHHEQAANLFSRGIELYTAEGELQSGADALVQRGNCYYDLGDHSMALEDADHALAATQYKHVDASNLRIRVLAGMGRHNEAIETCVLACAAFPNHPDLVKARSDLVDQVVAINTSPGTSTRRASLMNEAMAQVASYKHADAVTTLSVAILHAESHTQSACMYLHRGRSYMELHRYDLAAIDASVAMIPEDTQREASELLSKALLASDRLDEADIICSWALYQFPWQSSLQQIQAHIKMCRDQPHAAEVASQTIVHANSQLQDSRQKLKVIMKAGVALRASSHYEAADKIFDNALALLDSTEAGTSVAGLKTKRLNVLGHRARCALDAQNFESAIDITRSGLSMDCEWVEGYRLSCRAFKALKRWPESLQACRAVLDRVPHDTDFIRLGSELESNKDQKNSTKRRNQVPNTVPIKSNKGKKSSVTRWRQVADKVPLESNNFPDTVSQDEDRQHRVRELLRQGIVLVTKRKRVEEAEASFSEGLALLDEASITWADVDTLRAKLLSHRTRCRLELGRFEAAATDAREGIAREPDWIDGSRLLCRALMGLGAWDEAMQACKHVLSRVPHDVGFREVEVELLARCEKD